MKNKTIAAIIKDGHILLIVEDLKGVFTYYVVTEFTPAKSSGMESIDYHFLKGKDITEFYESHTMQNEKMYINDLNRMLEETRPIQMKFSANYGFRQYIA